MKTYVIQIENEDGYFEEYFAKDLIESKNVFKELQKDEEISSLTMFSVDDEQTYFVIDYYNKNQYKKVRNVKSNLFGSNTCDECKLNFDYYNMHEKHYTLCMTCGDIKEIKEKEL